MGKIIFKATGKIPRPPEVTEKLLDKINITNWRYLQEHALGITLVDNLLRVYDIFDITLDQFHQINHNNGTGIKSYKYIKNTLSCPFCEGSGVVVLG